MNIDRVATIILELCLAHGLPLPNISPALADDVCDVTGAFFVRLNPASCDMVDDRRYAAHVLGHYICDLGQSRFSDQVADLIGDWLLSKAHNLDE